MSNIKRYTTYLINFIDILSIILSYALSFYVRFFLMKTSTDYYETNYYYLFLALLILSYLFINIFYNLRDNELLKNGYFHNFINSIRNCLSVFAVAVIIMNFMKTNEFISRKFEVVYLAAFVLVNFILRQLVRNYLNNLYQNNNSIEKIVILTSAGKADRLVEMANKEYDWRNRLAGVLITDGLCQQDSIDGIRVMNDVSQLDKIDYDSVLIAETSDEERVGKWMDFFQVHGKQVHLYISEYDYFDSVRRIDSIGDCPVISFHVIAPMRRSHIMVKRFLDVLFSIILMPLLFVVYILSKIFIGLESPGSILVKRIRVGKNNVRFYQYRFRVYRSDAQKRLEQKRSPFTFWGRFLRKSHLDGLPMLLNVLCGDMSLVGPKAPNLPKYLNMSKKERNILAAKPGMIGYWSCSNSLDKIVDDETNYVENWNLFKDLSIMFVMVLRYISGNSLRIDGDKHIEEELQFCRQLTEDRAGIDYPGKQIVKDNRILYMIIKRAFDIVASLILLVLAAIPMLIISLIIMLSDGGLPIYSQKRVGLNGRIFEMFKFRSMVIKAGEVENILDEEQLKLYRTEFKLENDPRVTPFGNFLRRSSLDELPQLVNVLRGEMSLVGPRAILKEEMFLNYSAEQINRFISVLPGVTGYWQAYARNDADYTSGQRQQMELYYVDNRSILFDIRILFRTVYAVIARKGVR